MRPNQFAVCSGAVPSPQLLPEAQALRVLLIEAAQQVIQETVKIPGMESETAFLKSYLAGKKVSEIARELGVTREW